jgi:MFS transporter, SP family, solute carrier family 2 (myo-inositol transporter), member 13
VNTTVITYVIYLVERNTGYDTGVISGALVTIGSDLGPAELSNGQKVSIWVLISHGKLLGFYTKITSPCSLIIQRFPAFDLSSTIFNRNLSLLRPC